ncbi:hypothetical protein [Aeromonas hydrophila]|uniref:hypothetical protein n=1 Tax=Aeromonas hydrophila TaxID=644 RepID=UPI00301624AC
MLETFEIWIRDSVNQSVLISPLMGVVFGALFTFVTRGKRQDGTDSVKETIIIIKEKIIIREKSENNSKPVSNDDPWALVFVFIGAVVLATYLYAVFADKVIYYSSLLAFNFITFGLTSIVLSAFQSKITSSDWFLYTVLPVSILTGSLILLHYAQLGIFPGLKERAEIEGAVNLYFNVLEEKHKNWILTQLIGLVSAVLYLMLSCVLVLHNTSALQVRYGGFMQSFWAKVFLITHRFSGWGAVLFIVAIGVVSYLALNGTGYEFLMSRRIG